MAVFYYLLFKYQHDGRQNEHDGENAEHYTLCHDKADIKAQLQVHEAQREKAENRCQRAACKSGKALGDGSGHRLLTGGIACLFLGVAVDEEN